MPYNKETEDGPSTRHVGVLCKSIEHTKAAAHKIRSNFYGGDWSEC